MEIISYRDAKDKELKTFYTGIPCNFGHLSERRVIDRECVECEKEWEQPYDSNGQPAEVIPHVNTEKPAEVIPPINMFARFNAAQIVDKPQPEIAPKPEPVLPPPADKIISRDAAKQKGLKRYYTGTPCKYGHDAERFVLSYLCVKCNNKGYKKVNDKYMELISQLERSIETNPLTQGETLTSRAAELSTPT